MILTAPINKELITIEPWMCFTVLSIFIVILHRLFIYFK